MHWSLHHPVRLQCEDGVRGGKKVDIYFQMPDNSNFFVKFTGAKCIHTLKKKTPESTTLKKVRY